MTPATRATALILSTFVAAFAVAATVTFYATGAVLRRREVYRSEPRHLKHVGHRPAPRHEWLLWTVSGVVRFYRYEDGGSKCGVLLASLFCAFSVVIGATQ